MMLKIYTHSLGCPKNLVDTEHVLGALGDFIVVDELEDADVVFINTCAFIQSAVQESVATIVEIATQAGEECFIIVCGCLVGRYGTCELKKEVPEVNLWLETKDIDNWGSLVAAAVQEHFGIKLPAREYQAFIHDNRIMQIPVQGRKVSTAPSYAWLKVGEGCRHNCSFCTIPSIRGGYRSLDKEMLVSEAKAVVGSGIKELILVAQDVTAWGSDTDDKDLRPLLDGLFRLDGLERLRLMYLYPAGMTDTLLKYLQEAGDTFVPYFDIPLQHAHEDILARMGRPFAQNPEIAVDRIRKYARKDELMRLQAEISGEILEEYLGERMPVLIDREHEEWAGLYVGRTWFQAPDVDGITYVSAPPEVEIKPGMIVEADITETQQYDLVALV